MSHLLNTAGTAPAEAAAWPNVTDAAASVPDTTLDDATLADRRLMAAAPELLEALREAAMWMPILAEMSGVDVDETHVEFSKAGSSCPPVTISIASSIEKAMTALAKTRGGAA